MSTLTTTSIPGADPESLGIDFYSGFRGNAQGGSAIGNAQTNLGIDFYSGFRKKNSWGVQFEILQNSGIDFYSGFRKTSQGGVQF